MEFIATIFDSLLAIIRMIFTLLFTYYLWVPLAAILGYLAWQNRRREQWVSQTDSVLLKFDVPKDNDKKELSAEQMFASLHGILRPTSELRREGMIQEHISFEIASQGGAIQFYVWVPTHLRDFVESQIYAQYPTVQIHPTEKDYADTEPGDRTIYGTELSLTRPEVLPIRTFTSFEVDPLAGITGVLAKLDSSKEEAWIQVVSRPIDDTWQEKGKKYIEDAKNGRQPGFGMRILDGFLQLPFYVVQNFMMALVEPPKADPKKDAAKKDATLSTGQQALIKAVEEKTTKLGFEVKVRIAYLGPDEKTAKQRMQAIVGAFKQFNTTNLNGFSASKFYTSADFLDDYRARLFLNSGLILNIEELASLYHIPHMSVETPSMIWTTSKTSEPPSNLPTEATADSDAVSLFGLTNFRGQNLKFGIKRRDRGRHMYIVGQTGTGKSMGLELLTLSDIYHDQGFAIIDPHGDYATDMLKYIPEHRMKDVIYFNATDRDFPMAFNPMEVTDPNLKNHISSELVGVIKRMFIDSWGPRLEYILRYTLLALLDHEGATMLDITRMLVDKDFRKAVIRDIEDPVVRNFWVTEFASWNDKFAAEAVAPVLNKVGAFTANPLIRNIVGQPKSAFNIRKIMDEGKILVVNLSRGQVGEDNAAILGSLMVTKIQLAAMSRADMPLDQRRPFYLYVDEFQNFATDSFAVIMSEARKYGLNLTVANQYVSQMPETVRDAVFGNVGTMISFRIGPDDSQILAKYFAPIFLPEDITRLNNQHIFISMMINGEKAPAFSARTLRMPDPENDRSEEIFALSRQQFARPRAEVVAEINESTTSTGFSQSPGNRAMEQNLATGAQSGQQPVLVGAAAVQGPNGTHEQYKPRSEFLSALKNPSLPPATAGPGRGEGSGGARPEQRREDRGPRGDMPDRRGGRGGSLSNGQGRGQGGGYHKPSREAPAPSAQGREVRPGEPVRLRQ